MSSTHFTSNIFSSPEEMLDDTATDFETHEDGHKYGIPTGALTVLVIAAVAITSVVVTLFCMLVNNRRGRRTARRIESINSTSSTSTSISQPSMGGPVVPHIILSNETIQGPKYFDAPPSYDEAVSTPTYTPTSPTPLTSMFPSASSPPPTQQFHSQINELREGNPTTSRVTMVEDTAPSTSTI